MDTEGRIEADTEWKRELLMQERICDGFLALLLTAYLLWFDANKYRAITAAKRNAFYVLFGGFLLAILCSIVICLSRPDRRAALAVRLRRASPALWCMLGYLLLTLLSTLFSAHPEAWLGASRNEGFVTQLLYVLSFLALLLFARPKRWHVYAFAVGLTALCAVSILQLLRWNPFGLYPDGYDFYNLKEPFLGTVGNVGFLGALFCVAVPVLTVSVLRLEGKLRFLLLLPLAGCLFVLFCSSILAAYVGLAAGFMAALPFVLRFSGRTMKIYYLSVLLLLLVGIAVLYFTEPGSGTLQELHELLHGRTSDRFGSGRLYIWRQTLERVPQRLWLGHGPDTMYLERLLPFTRHDAETGKTVAAAIDAAHNEYLNILFHQGVLALAAYLAGLGVSLVSFFRRARDSALAAVFGTAVLCYAIQALFGISQPITAPYFWMALGMLCASVRREDLPESRSDVRTDAPSTGS